MNWIERKLSGINRRRAAVYYDPHYIAREAERNLKINLVERTVRFGSIVVGKCTAPDRICFKLYYGKSNETYEVPVKVHHYFLEVKSAWKRKGKY